MLLLPLICFSREKHRKDPALICDGNWNEGSKWTDTSIFNQQTASNTGNMASGQKGASLNFSGTTQCFADGIQRSTTNTDCTGSPVTDIFYLGSNNGSNILNGKIDNWKIYKRKLTAIEIYKLYMKELNETGHN